MQMLFEHQVEQRSDLTGEDAKRWCMGELIEGGFQARGQRLFHLEVDNECKFMGNKTLLLCQQIVV